MSIGGVARGGLFLFIGYMATSILGYVFWVLVSTYSGSNAVGVASSIVALSTVISGIAMLGLSTGVKRFLGREYGHKNVRSLNTYFWTSLTFTLALSSISALVIWAIALLNVPLVGFSQAMLFLIGLLSFLNFFGIIEALLVSIIKTEYIAFSNLISGTAKIGLGTYLVYIGFGWLGAIVGVMLSSVLLIVFFLVFALRELRHLGGIKIRFSFKALRESLHASFAVYVPEVVSLLGQQLGILIVFGLEGGSQAGAYFIAFIIYNIVYMIPNSLMVILFPTLSGMDEVDRKDLAWKGLKISLAIACPLVAFLMVYPEFPLSFMGSDYAQAAPTLSLLVSSVIPFIFLSVVTDIIFAAGFYGRVLGLNLAVNVPRIILYFQLVPLYGEFGAALSFLAGTIIGFGVAVGISKQVGFHVSLRKVTVAILTPATVALLGFLMGWSWFITGIMILLASALFYGISGVVERSDVAEIVRGLGLGRRNRKSQ